MQQSEYHGSYPFFPFESVRTYSIATRSNKVTADSLIQPAAVLAEDFPRFESAELRAIANAVLAAKERCKPVIVFTGAHLIKNGFGLLLIDLMRRGFVTLVATNGAGMTHDFELAFIGATSESVADALPQGLFGMCHETAFYMNHAFRAAVDRGIGAGEALGRLILGEAMPEVVRCAWPDVSIAAAGITHHVPVTMHATIGTDIIDQHPASDPAAKGGASGLDFGVFAAQVAELSGGVFLNLGSAVQGPEVFLKAVSMAANIGRPPTGLTTASFDIRPVRFDDIDDERTATYYCRDLKSVVYRIPAAFTGIGHYVQGDHLQTIPALYWHIVKGG